MKKLFTTLLGLFTFACLTQAQQLNIELETFASGFSRPVDIAHCGDDRLFIVEQHQKKIWILDKNGDRLDDPFLTLPVSVSTGNEQGLLGLAFHPDYATNGYFFVNFTKSNSDTRISRFKVSDDDPNKADATSEKIILEVDQPFSNHNGGGLKFGPDGYLYIGLGDGGSGGDPQNNGQKRTTMLGKMLRIDVDNGDPYDIPADNPFINDPNTLDEIWALGLRNPWRYSFDRLTGDLWIGDVGQNAWEEIDFQPAASTGGENYGWRCYEGNHPYETSGCVPVADLTMPVAEFENPSIGCSVTGGFVYRGCQYPNLYGYYLYTDYCSGRLWTLFPDGAGGWTEQQVENLTDFQYSSFGENKNGELFLAGLGNGLISRVKETGISFNYELATANVACEGDEDGTATFTLSGDVGILQFAWSDGSNEQDRDELTPGSYTVSITGGNGCIATETIEISVENPFTELPTVSVTQDSLLSANAGFNTYQWLLNGVFIAGATEQNFTAQMSGNYSVLVTNTGACEAESEQVAVTVISGSNEIFGVSQMSITPNPFGESLRISFLTVQPLPFELRLTDAQGKLLFSEKMTAAGVFEKTLDLKSLAAGTYFLSLQSERGEWTEQVVKK